MKDSNKSYVMVIKDEKENILINEGSTWDRFYPGGMDLHECICVLVIFYDDTQLYYFQNLIQTK